MIVYFGAPRPWELAILKEEGATHILTSYADDEFRRVMELSEGLNVMIDSGAYSAWSRGAEIRIEDYAAALETYQAEQYVNLDVYGDREQTDRNQEYLENRGLKPLPVYHAGEPITVLEKLARKYEYLGLGGLIALRQRIGHKVTAYIQKLTDEYPEIKFHGFGVGTLGPEHMKFYSVDSTTWLSAARYNRQIGRVKIIRGEKAGLFWTRTELLRHNIRALLWQQDNVRPYEHEQVGLFNGGGF